MSDLDKCWDVLPKVSRSFSLCIKILPDPINRQMMLSYLVYRVIDTIEDSHITPEAKRALFDQFISLLKGKTANEMRLAKLKRTLLTCLDFTYEKDLLENLDALAHAYFAEPVKIRSAIRRWGRVMAKGMCEFQSKKIDTFKDQDLYSYYVAGVVGYLINDLLYYNDIITAKAKRRLRIHARRFGLALQKVNILRDVAHDIPEKRFYWPIAVLNKYELNYQTLLQSENREKAMKVLREEIDDALKYLYSGMYYVLSLPNTALRVRMFCLIPLFMAIESYVKCIDNKEIFESQKTVKIDRVAVQDIVAKSTLWGGSNKDLVRWFAGTIAKASPQLAKSKYMRGIIRLQETPVRE
jgi:farnesyl-diphosphate farnesyltransferase